MNSLTKLSGERAMPASSGDPLLAFACDEDTLDIITRVVPGGRRGVEVREGGINAAQSAVNQGACPELLIVDISDSASPVSDVSGLTSSVGPDTTVVALGPENDVALYRSLLSAGVTDYLVKPVSTQELRRTILAAGESTDQAEQTAKGRVSALIGARGGVGVSSLAIGVAWTLAQDFRKQVALVDLDLHFGTVALNLDLEPGNGLRSALENADRIDSLFVASALVNVSDNLFVLGGEEPLDQTFEPQPEAFELLMTELRRIFDVILIDLPRHMVPTAVGTLSTADGIAVVTDLSLAGLRDAARLRTSLGRIAPDTSLSIIANRVGLEKASELPRAEFEKGLGSKIDVYVPEEPRAAKAALSGKPLVTALKANRGGAALEGLARRLGAVETAERRRRLFGFWK